jgi:hypothetical protein
VLLIFLKLYVDVGGKSISTCATKFIVDRGVGWAVLGAPAGPPLKLGAASYTGAPKTPASQKKVAYTKY